MKTLFYPAHDTLTVADQPVPSIADDEVLLKVSACGICGSELEGFKNRSPRRTPPLVMGHEFCGVVDQVGRSVPRDLLGKKVVSNALVPCGNCVRCRRGDPHLCGQRQVFGMNRLGAFGEYVNVPARCLIAWPENLPARAACLAEPLANGVHIHHLTEHLRPRTVLVLGAGPIGLMCQQVMQVLGGASTFVSDLSPERLAVAQRLGAKRVIHARNEDAAAVCRELTEGEGVDLVIDAAGAAATKRQSIAAARPGGAAVWIGLHENEMTFNSFDITLAERTIIGSYAARIEDLREAVDLMRDGKVDVTSWTTPFPIEDSVSAFRRMLAARGNDIKAVIIPG